MRVLILTWIMLLSLMCSNENGPNPDPEPEVPNQARPELRDFPINQISFGSDWDFHPRWSRDSRMLAFARHDPDGGNTSIMLWHRASDVLETILSGMRGDFSVSWSPDNLKIAFDARDENDVSQIYILTLADKAVEQFTAMTTNVFRPDWSPDGRTILFTGSSGLYRQDIDSGQRLLVTQAYGAWNPCWRPDGEKILFSSSGASDAIYSINPDGSDLQILGNSRKPADIEVWPRWHPSGTTIVYEWFDGSESEICIKNLNSSQENLLTQWRDCRFPDWSPDGQSIVFSYDSKLWVIDVSSLEMSLNNF